MGEPSELADLVARVVRRAGKVAARCHVDVDDRGKIRSARHLLGYFSLLCPMAERTAPKRCSARSSASFCSSAVTTMASEPGKTVATWSFSSQRTTYGGDPSEECTSVINPRWSGRSTAAPLNI